MLSGSKQTKRKNAQKTTLKNTKKELGEEILKSSIHKSNGWRVPHKKRAKKYVAIAMAITAVLRCWA